MPTWLIIAGGASLAACAGVLALGMCIAAKERGEIERYLLAERPTFTEESVRRATIRTCETRRPRPHVARATTRQRSRRLT